MVAIFFFLQIIDLMKCGGTSQQFSVVFLENWVQQREK